MKELELTANRSGEEPWRLERLQEVKGWLMCQWKIQPPTNKFLDFGLLHLHDHKGDLSVAWSRKITAIKGWRLWLDDVESAWLVQNEPNVYHIWEDKFSETNDAGSVCFDPDDPNEWQNPAFRRALMME